MKIHWKKYIALPLTLCLVLSLGACTASSGRSSAKAKTSKPATSSAGSSSAVIHAISLPYAMNRQLNPFQTDCQINYELWPLMYDSLSEPDQNFNPANNLASSIDNSGNKVTVHLQSNVKFSDGTSLTAQDVRYSFYLALNPASCFYSRVSNINGISISNSATIVFTLKTPDPLIGNMLDVPIIKQGSDTAGLPIGSGRYVFSKSGNDAVLTANSKWFKNKTPALTTINLINMPDDSAVLNSFQMATIDYLYSGYGTNAASNVNTDTSNINLNQLLYVGMNASHAALSDAHVRKAISLLIDRQTIVKEVLSSHAQPTDLPFNPSWSQAPTVASAAVQPDHTGADKELTQAGYTQKDANGTLTNAQSAGKTLSLSLLVNGTDSQQLTIAQRIAAALKNEGFAITITQAGYADYTAAVAAGNFDLYLAGIQLPDNMDLSSFFVAGGSASAGMLSGSKTYAAYTDWLNGKAKVADICSAFSSEVPFAPICYSYGLVSYHKNFYSNVKVTNYNLFFNVEDWHM